MRFSIFAVAAAFIFAGATAVHSAEPRLVTVGGAITETVYALGLGSEVVAVDSASLYPEAAAQLPRIGFDRTISAEGVLGLNPTMLIATTDAGPPNVLDQIRGSGVKVVVIKAEPTVQGAKEKIQATADAVGKTAEGKALVKKIDQEIAKVPPAKSPEKRPRVMFIYARGGATLNVSGIGTAANAMIEAAGGRNAITGYEGYKPLTAESAVNGSPDLILLTTRGLESMGGIDGLLKSPGLAETPAGHARRVIAIDDVKLLSFGPRTGEGITELATELQK